MRFGDCELLPDGLLVTPEADRQLSKRQAQVLSALALSMPVAVSTDALLDAAWGAGAGSSQQLAKAVSGIRQMLEGSRNLLIESVYGYGYRLTLAGQDTQPNPRTIAAAICDEATHRLTKRRVEAIRVAQRMLEKAGRVDSGYVRVPLGYAEARQQLAIYGYEPGIKVWPAVASAARDALEIDPESAMARAYLGLGACTHDWDYAASNILLDEALGRAPWDPAILEMAGRAKFLQGLHDEALDLLGRGLGISPASARLRSQYLFVLAALGDRKAADAELEKLNTLDPYSAPGHRIWYQAAYGQPEAAVAMAETFKETSPASSNIAAVHALGLANSGRCEAARSLIRSLNDADRFHAPASALLSTTWCALGDDDAAIAALEAAADARDFWLGAMLWHPVNERLFSLPGFIDLRERVAGRHSASLPASA